MFYLKRICWVMLAIVCMGGVGFDGCGACETICAQAQMNEEIALSEWNAAQQAYDDAVSSGADQAEIDQLAIEETQARASYQDAVENRQISCG